MTPSSRIEEIRQRLERLTPLALKDDTDNSTQAAAMLGLKAIEDIPFLLAQLEAHQACLKSARDALDDCLLWLEDRHQDAGSSAWSEIKKAKDALLDISTLLP